MLRIHLLQYSSKLGDVEFNLNRLIKAMETLCVGDGADLIVTPPELYLPGYMSRDMFFQIAEPIGGKTITRLVMEPGEGIATLLLGLRRGMRIPTCFIIRRLPWDPTAY